MVSLTLQFLLCGLPALSDHGPHIPTGRTQTSVLRVPALSAVRRPEPLGQPLLNATLVPGALFWLQAGHAGLGRPSS